MSNILINFICDFSNRKDSTCYVLKIKGNKMNRKQFFTLSEKIVSEYYNGCVISSYIYDAYNNNDNNRSEFYIRFYINKIIVILKIKAINLKIIDLEYFSYYFDSNEIKEFDRSSSVNEFSRLLSVFIGEYLEKDVIKSGHEKETE